VNGPVLTPRTGAHPGVPRRAMSAAASASGTTLNDVGLFVLDAAMNRDLRCIGRPADRALVAICPVSLPDPKHQQVSTQVSAFWTPLGHPTASIGRRMRSADITKPGEQLHAAQMNSLLFIQLAFDVLALFLSALRVENLVSAMLTGQVREIALGATAAQGERPNAGNDSEANEDNDATGYLDRRDALAKDDCRGDDADRRCVKMRKPARRSGGNERRRLHRRAFRGKSRA